MSEKLRRKIEKWKDLGVVTPEDAGSALSRVNERLKKENEELGGVVDTYKQKVDPYRVDLDSICLGGC